MIFKGVSLFLTFFFLASASQKPEEQEYGDRKLPESTRRTYDSHNFEMLDDMIIHNEIKNILFDPDIPEDRRNAVVNEDLLWPDKTIRFYIDEEFKEKQRKEIQKGIDMITSNSCIKFVELEKPPAKLSVETPYVHISSISGCYAHVGSMCGKCQMSLDIPGGCVRQGTIAHEFLHALGFYHMQCAAGRSNHIEILWENLKNASFPNFEEYADSTTLLGTAYDTDSIMHYGTYFFTKNKKMTIKTKNPSVQKKIGQRKKLSKGDIERLNILYKC